MSAHGDPGMAPGDELPADAGNAGEDICPTCHGDGTVDGRPCGDCGGSGRIVVAVGGG